VKKNFIFAEQQNQINHNNQLIEDRPCVNNT